MKALKFAFLTLLLSQLTACMTEADRLVWAEAKAHLGTSKNEAVAEAPSDDEDDVKAANAKADEAAPKKADEAKPAAN